jgi:hypothetical protein
MCQLITFNQQTTTFALALVMLQTWQQLSRQRLHPNTPGNIADPAIKQRLLLMDSGCLVDRAYVSTSMENEVQY